MHERRVKRRQAERLVRRRRGRLPATVASDCIYIKLFKNMPRGGVEMIFPDTELRLRLFDKVMLAAIAGAGLLIGVFGATGKLAAMSNPYVLLGAIGGLGGIALRQAANLLNARARYMVARAQNLYFHAMADNRGVMTLLAERAAEEDVKEEMLLYTWIANLPPFKARDLETIDQGIEGYLKTAFGIDVDFDISDAFARLKQEGIITELEDGTLKTLPPAEAALHIDKLWDACLDQLPDITTTGEGEEMTRPPGS